ncbi:hypothetical protein ACWD4J_05135 [Streptomyces sp. NPDC002577]
MVLETLGSAVIGLAVAWVAARLLPHRLPARTLVLPTGVVGGLFGAFVTHSALGAGHTPLTLLGALAVAIALLSLLIRPAGLRRSATA